MTIVNAQWHALLSNLLARGEEVRPRDRTTKELLAYQTVVPMNQPLLTVAARNLGYKFAMAEPAWIASGDNKVSTIKPFARHVSAFSDDGFTYFGAYGPKFVDQLSFVVETLVKDPMSRQAVMTFWREKPGSTKDVPCTLSLQFIIRSGQLHCVTTMRSSDAWFGWPYDVHNFSVMAMCVLIQLRNRIRDTFKMPDSFGVTPPNLGFLTLTAGSQHLYKADWDAARALVSEHAFNNCPPITPHAAAAFEYDPVDLTEFPTVEEFVGHYWALARGEPTPFKWLKEIYNRGERAAVTQTVQT